MYKLVGKSRYTYDMSHVGHIHSFLQYSVRDSFLSEATNWRGTAALQASRYNYGNEFQSKISDNQWQIELEGWFQISLVKLQRASVRMIRTPGLDRARVENDYADDPESLRNMQRLCNYVKFKSEDHRTYGMMGIVIVIVGTVLTTILSFWVDWSGHSQAWEEDEVLALLEAIDKVSTSLHFRGFPEC